jgi:hypothetical protein
MKNTSWRPHQRGASPQRTWEPKEWEEFAKAQEFFVKKKKKNRGTKRVQWWADKKKHQHGSTSGGGSSSWKSPPPPPPPLMKAPPPLLSGGSDSVLVPSKPRPSGFVGPKLPAASIPTIPSLHGDSPGVLFHVPKATQIWIPMEAMRHIQEGMPGRQGHDFLNLVFPNVDEMVQASEPGSSTLMTRPPIYEIEDEEETTGGTSVSSSRRPTDHLQKRARHQ